MIGLLKSDAVAEHQFHVNRGLVLAVYIDSDTCAAIPGPISPEPHVGEVALAFVAKQLGFAAVF